MKRNQSGTIKRKSKPKRDIIALIVIFILGGIILMIIPFMIEEDSESGSESIVDGSYGITRILDPGDKLEIEYSMSGEESEVYLTKGTEYLFLTKDEDIIRYIPNASSGTISYTVEEKMGIYSMYFSGKNLTVDYSYKITNIYKNLNFIVGGVMFIIAGIISTWNILHYTNPKYIGNNGRYYSLLFLILAIFFIYVVFISYKLRTLLPFPIVLLIFSWMSFSYNKTMSSRYSITINSSTITTARGIYLYLKLKKIEFEIDRNVKERPYYWHTVFHLKDCDAQIKVSRYGLRKQQSMILLGKQTEQNRVKLIRLTNNIANRLKCENFRLIPE